MGGGGLAYLQGDLQACGLSGGGGGGSKREFVKLEMYDSKVEKTCCGRQGIRLTADGFGDKWVG